MAEIDEVPEPRKLGKKPLVEAIFELKWELSGEQPGPARDPGFQLLLGRFYERMKEEYPVAVPLPTSLAPPESLGHTVIYQFRSAKDAWPLVQLGPGILTVNDTEGYTWDGFLGRLDRVLHTLSDTYPPDLQKPRPVLSQLRYINAVPYGQLGTAVPRLLREQLHTELRVDDRLFPPGSNAGDSPNELALHLEYPLEAPKGVGVLNFTTGWRGGEATLIWEIGVRSVSDDTPASPGAFPAWLGDAHDLAERWFLTLCRGSLYQSFL